MSLCVCGFSVLQVKGVALELADMQAYLDKRVKTDEALQQDIQDTFRELNK